MASSGTRETLDSTVQLPRYVRVVEFKESEVEKLVEIGVRALAGDPVFSYFAQLSKPLNLENDTKEANGLRQFIRFLLKACLIIGGRVTAVVDPNTKHVDGSDKLVATAFWLPPKKRLAIWKVYTIVAAGGLGPIRRWGLTGLLRISGEYADNAHSKMAESFKLKGVTKRSTDDSWYVQLTYTDPEYQGQGCLSLLMREGFAYAPECVFVLEATTAKSRDQYAHLGFENPVCMTLGRGKANKRGLSDTGTDASGVDCWAMSKWPKAKSPDHEDLTQNSGQAN